MAPWGIRSSRPAPTATPSSPSTGTGSATPTEARDYLNAFDPNALTAWSNRFFNGSNGIAATSKTATVYGDGGSGDDGSTGDIAPNGYPYCVNGSASDPDGDGWGWEYSRSCVVRGSAADR